MAPIVVERVRGRTTEEIDEAVSYYGASTSERSQDDEESGILADTQQEVRHYRTGEFHTTSMRVHDTLTDIKSLQEELAEEDSDLLGVSETQEVSEQLLASSRETELAWISSHSGELKAYEGQWVVVEGSQLVAHDFDFVKVVDEARSKGIKIPYVTKVEAERGIPFVG